MIDNATSRLSRYRRQECQVILPFTPPDRIESIQESKVLDAPPCSEKQVPSSPNDDDVDDDKQHPRWPGSTGRQHASSPMRELQPAFNLEDHIRTINSHRSPHAGDSHNGGALRHDAHRHR